MAKVFKCLGGVVIAIIISVSSYLWLKHCIDTDKSTTKTSCEKAYELKDALANNKEARKIMETNSKYKGYKERLNNFTSKKCEGYNDKMYFRFGNVIFGS